MEIVSTIESAVHAAVEAVEHPFHTIGARLKAAGQHLADFARHPYAAPPLKDALDALHGVVADLAQEVAELRVPCPCNPAPTSQVRYVDETETEAASTTAAAGDAGQVLAQHAQANADQAAMTAADLADFRAWQKAKADAAAFTGQA